MRRITFAKFNRDSEILTLALASMLRKKVHSEIISWSVLSLLLSIWIRALSMMDLIISWAETLVHISTSNSESILWSVKRWYRLHNLVALAHEKSWCSIDSTWPHIPHRGESVRPNLCLRSLQNTSLYKILSLIERRVGFLISHKFVRLASDSSSLPGGGPVCSLIDTFNVNHVIRKFLIYEWHSYSLCR